MRLPVLLLLGYVAVIAILIGSGALMATRMCRDLKAQIGRDAETLAASLMSEVDRAMRDRLQALQTFAGTNTELHAALEASNRSFDALTTEGARNARIAAADREWPKPGDEPNALMREILDSRASHLLRQTMIFHERTRGQPVFAEIFVTNRHGANVGQTGRTSDYGQSDETWWQRTWSEGIWASGEVGYDDSAGVHSIDIGVRVESTKGGPLGVLKAVLNVAALRDIIDGFRRHSRLQGAFVELLDSNGRLIHRQDDPDSFGESMREQGAVRALAADQEGSLVESSARGEALRAYVLGPQDSALPSVGWALILNQPTEVVFAHLSDLRRRSFTIGIVGAVAAILVGLFISLVFGRMTQRLRDTRDALQQSDAQIRSIFSSVVDGIVTTSPLGRIESVNPAAEQILGYEAADLIGQNVSVLVPERYKAEHARGLRRYLETGNARIIGTVREVEGLRKDGTVFPLDLAIGEIRAGSSQRFVGILRDVSERHEAQHALRAAKEAAEAANRAKSQFLANMSHELRTPLNAVIGYAEMVAEELQERDEEDLVTDLTKIQMAGHHLLGLINDILDLSKIEAGHADVHAESFELSAILTEIASTVKPLVAEKDNEFVFDVPADLGVVYTDLTKLRQILYNLLSNASKFTQSGRITMYARREAAEPHDWLEFRIADTGIGMTAAQVEGVWEAFAQADASTTRKYGGTGLGLTITRTFSEMLGGSISVDSREGQGTVFTVRLPAPATAAGAETAAPVEPGDAGRPRTDTVLIVDDDPAARELVRRFLVRDGLDVVGAADGEEGLRLAGELRPAVVVLDVMLPGMDGWTVLAALRDDPALADTPVVMLTMVQERGRGFALGVDAYLTKPIDRATLASVLARFRTDPSKRTILVVEDERKARNLLARMLEKDGWQVLEAEDGRAALECMEATRPDFVLLDLMMPVMDGFQLVEAIRADARWRDIPLAIVTAKDLTPDESARLEGSVQQIVQKGRHAPSELLDEVGRLVKRALKRDGR